MIQHESHQLVFPLSSGRGALYRPDELQLLQVLKGLSENKKNQFHLAVGFLVFVPVVLTFMMTGCSKLYMELDFLCRNFLNSECVEWRKKSGGSFCLTVFRIT